MIFKRLGLIIEIPLVYLKDGPAFVLVGGRPRRGQRAVSFFPGHNSDVFTIWRGIESLSKLVASGTVSLSD